MLTDRSIDLASIRMVANRCNELILIMLVETDIRAMYHTGKYRPGTIAEHHRQEAMQRIFVVQEANTSAPPIHTEVVLVVARLLARIFVQYTKKHAIHASSYVVLHLQRGVETIAFGD